MTETDRLWAGSRSHYAVSIALGIWAAFIAVTPTTAAKLLFSAPMVIAPVCWWCLLQSQRWLLLFLCALVVLPPLPISLGDSGPHPALAILVFGLFICISQLHRFSGKVDPSLKVLLTFTFALLVSVLSAAIVSGVEIAIGSLLRVLLFAIGPFVFLYASHGPESDSIEPLKAARLLFWAGLLAALFACIDFYVQFPTPAGFGAQFVWLDEGVFRRAQGFFYEASTLGNFCAFFLVMILVALCRPGNQVPCSRLELVLGGMLLSLALVLSYSRGSVLNVCTAALTLAFLERERIRQSAITLSIWITVPLIVLYISFPSFALSYWTRLSGSLKYIWSTPNGVLSGRLESWSQLGQFLGREPWHVFFGVGYKTLAYSQVAGSTVIADNTYLSLLVETGVLGLGVFLLLNLQVLRTSVRAAKSSSETSAFFGTWFFCFWVGEIVQMGSGDLITYWRVLPFYFWVLSQASRSKSLWQMADRSPAIPDLQMDLTSRT